MYAQPTMHFSVFLLKNVDTLSYLSNIIFITFLEKITVHLFLYNSRGFEFISHDTMRYQLERLELLSGRTLTLHS